MTTSIEEKRRILVAQDGVKERFSQLNRKIGNNRHEELMKFSDISEHCGYIEVRRNSSNMCHATKMPGLHICCADICQYIDGR